MKSCRIQGLFSETRVMDKQAAFINRTPWACGTCGTPQVPNTAPEIREHRPELTIPCREHNQFLEEVRAHVLHNGPRPGGQMLSRATLASRSSGDLAGQDELAAAQAAQREDSTTVAAVGSAAPTTESGEEER